MRLRYVVSTAIFARLSLSSVLSQPKFPISNPLCPVLPSPSSGTHCGPFTHRWCDSPTASCGFCLQQGDGGASLLESTAYHEPPGDYIVDLESYAFYHVLNLEYMVEFSKNPMPFQPKLDLPFCGLQSRPNATLERRFKFPKKIGGTLGQIGEGLKKVGKEIEKGLAPIAAPFFEPAPKFLPRPACIPKTIQVPVHFTVFTTNFTTSQIITADVLQKQLNLTNEAFKPLGISFFISSLSYHTGLEWERFTHNKNGGDANYYAYAERIKAENRYGGNDEVSIWVMEKIDEVNCETSVATNGYCTLARSLGQKGQSVDGCAITIDSLPGISWRGGYAGTGKTLTHELGHWFDLPHIFPDKAGADCEGESDGITDTFQFPNNANMWNDKQPRCCSTGSGKKKKWSFCSDDTPYDVTNYMSYSRIAGEVIAGNDPGSMPWTTEQRSHMFATYFTLRRPRPRGGITCVDYPVFFDEDDHTAKRSFHTEKRRFGISALRGKYLFKQGDRLLDQLKKVCASPPEKNGVHAIDAISGEVVLCDENGDNCNPPISGPSCPDGSSPPCSLEPACIGGGSPPCELETCEDGSAPPCPDNGGNTNPDGKSSCPGGKSGDVCPEGSEPTCKPKPKDGGNGKDDEEGTGSVCPSGCDVHSNNCDKTTAPTCIFPDPRVSKPRAACACRPGYKASAYTDTDTTKQWRLPIPGQEHRVWVAEGVVCDKLCTISTGFNSCREVSEVSEQCASL